MKYPRINGSGLVITIFSIFLFGPLILTGQSLEQSTIAVQGNYDQSTDMSLSWTLGDLVIETGEIENVIMTQGFQQTFFTARKLGGNDPGPIEAIVFPNPTNGNAQIKTLGNLEKFTFQLYDAMGRVILAGSSMNAQHALDLSLFDTGLYLLKISDELSGNQSIFEIIKF